MNHKLTWDNTGYFIDGKPAPFISAEFHYFRVPHDDWERRLLLLKESGANTVATYIPWIVHEETEGDITFDDCPQRNLSEFLALCDKLDLMVVARPGPYTYSEQIRYGLPNWLLEDYPEIIAQRQTGGIVGLSAVSYIHPTFLEKAEKYITAACEVIRPFLVTNGGPVVMVQIDNELCGVHVWAGAIDYNPTAMGFGKKGGHYPEFLREKYGTVEAMNKAYGTDFSDFTDANPQKNAPSESTVFGKRFKTDYCSSYFKAIEKYAEKVASWMRVSGINVPLCTNSASVHETPYLYNLPSLLSKDGMPFVLGTDHYYSLGPGDGWSNNPTPQLFLKWMTSLDLISETGSPSTVFEMQSGNFADFPELLREPTAACYMLHTALGLKGANYYIFSGGPNFKNTGSTADVYDFLATVSAEGEIRPHYYSQKENNEFCMERPWMQRVDRTSNVQIGFTWEQRRQKRACTPRFARDGVGIHERATAWQFAMVGEGYHPRFVELGNKLDVNKLLVLPCDDKMSKEKQENVVEFLKAGGKMIITPFVPELDEDFNPCTILKDFLGIGEIRRIDSNMQRSIYFPDGEKVYHNSVLYTCDIEDAEPVLYNKKDEVHPVAFKKSVGKGEFIWFGSVFDYMAFSQNMMVDRLFRLLGTEPLTQCSKKGLWTTIIEDGEHATCFVINLFAGKQTASIKVKANGVWHDLGTVEAPAMTVLPIDLY